LASGKQFFRFTDGTEDSEEVVGFSFEIIDEAGNVSLTQTTTNGTSLRFDRTDPIIQGVSIRARSADNTAYLGDVPRYYAKQGDSIDLEMQICDYVDSLNNPPTGTLFGENITMVNGGQTGEGCTTPEGNGSIWRRWTVELTNIDGIEGTVTFDIEAKDNAGNLLVNIIGTTDNTEVIYDETNPTQPTEVTDGRGIETIDFKHRRYARYNWSGHDDNLAGIWRFDLELINPLTDVPDPSYNELASVIYPLDNHNFYNQKILPSSDIEYELWIDVIDKAGNNTGRINQYNQLYTIGVSGIIRDKESGEPIKNAVVQVAARNGDTCNDPRHTCVELTDENGEYAIVTQKDREYTLSAWEDEYYMEKEQIYVPFEDLNKDIGLKKRGSQTKEKQEGNELVKIVTDRLFWLNPDDSEQIVTEIIASSWGGEINVKQRGEEIIITSLSTITIVRSNNPEVVIRKTNNNKYTVTNAGIIQVISANEVENPKYVSTGKSFTSGESRLGVRKIPTSGLEGGRWAGMAREDFVGMGHFWTEAESKAYIEKANAGQKGRIRSYVNENGYRVFAGYVSGSLPLDKFEKRAPNPVIYRDKRMNKSDKSLKSLKEKNKEMKKKYQYKYHEVETPKHTQRIGRRQGIRKLRNKDAAKTVEQARDHRKNYVNKFIKAPSPRTQAPTRLTKRDLGNVKMVINGKSVSMDILLTGRSRRGFIIK
jgi:hypothetical protein